MTKLGSLIPERLRVPEASKSKQKRKFWRFISTGALIVAVGVPAMYCKIDLTTLSSLERLSLAKSSTGNLKLSGELESDETSISVKTGGRVNELAVREGDQVHQGQVVAQLDDADVQAQLRGATAQIAQAQQQEQQYDIGISVVASQIKEAQLNLLQARGQARGTIYQAEAQLAQNEALLAQAQAQVKQSEADLNLARVNRERYAQLVNVGSEAQLQADQALATYQDDLATLEGNKAAVIAAQKKIEATRGGRVQARSTGFNSNIRYSQITTLRGQLAQAQAQQKAAAADMANAIAARAQIAAQISYLKVTSPIDGVVTARSVEPGAVVTSGTTLLTVSNPNIVYLRTYVPEENISQVWVGQPAKVRLDSNPDHPFTAHVKAIDAAASFFPEKTLFNGKRIKPAFGIKIRIDAPAGLAASGMPAEAEIVTQPGRS